VKIQRVESVQQFTSKLPGFRYSSGGFPRIQLSPETLSPRDAKSVMSNFSVGSVRERIHINIKISSSSSNFLCGNLAPAGLERRL
jgi:hypothetical protein